MLIWVRKGMFRLSFSPLREAIDWTKGRDVSRVARGGKAYLWGLSFFNSILLGGGNCVKNINVKSEWFYLWINFARSSHYLISILKWNFINFCSERISHRQKKNWDKKMRHFFFFKFRIYTSFLSWVYSRC